MSQPYGTDPLCTNKTKHGQEVTIYTYWHCEQSFVSGTILKYLLLRFLHLQLFCQGEETADIASHSEHTKRWERMRKVVGSMIFWKFIQGFVCCVQRSITMLLNNISATQFIFFWSGYICRDFWWGWIPATFYVSCWQLVASVYDQFIVVRTLPSNTYILHLRKLCTRVSHYYSTLDRAQSTVRNTLASQLCAQIII